MKRVLRLLAMCLSVVFFACGCSRDSNAYADGYFTAEAKEFDSYGWKEYVTICISDDQIVSVEYDARNASGFIKSWDMEYMRVMNEADGTYPNAYVRQYTAGLITRQNPDRVDAVTGATHSHYTFQLLSKACLEQAKNRGESIVYVQLPAADESGQGTVEGAAP